MHHSTLVGVKKEQLPACQADFLYRCIREYASRFMRDGVHLLCGPLNHGKWLPLHLWEYEQLCYVWLLSAGDGHLVCKRHRHLFFA